jgi:hypothetical protein
MDFLDILKEKAFLGREFLTWLWYKSDQTGGRIELKDARTVEIFFLDRMTLDMMETDTPQLVTLKGEYSGLREGLAALKEGKKIEEARLKLRIGENEFTMVLKGTWFSYGSFKTPPILPPSEMDHDEDQDGAFLEKIYLIEEGLEIMDALFDHFLKLRISADWEKEELLNIRKWIESEL